MPDSPSPHRRRKHDEVYKYFFSQAATVAELLEDYLAPEWVHQLDLSTLRKLTPEHVSSQLSRRQADMLWRVDFRHQPGFLVLHLEFQSTVDRFMAARVLRYVADTYEDLVREKQSSDPVHLPPVLVCIIHNGPPPWDALADIALLVSPTLPWLRDFTVRLLHLVLDMRAPPGRELRKRRILTWLRELERDGGTVEKVVAVLDEVAEAYPGPEHARTVRGFELWAVGAARLWGRTEEELSQITNLQEARKMYTQIREEIARLRAEGRAEGLQEGLQEGHHKGHREGRREARREARREEAKNLFRQAAKKFGEDAAAPLAGVISGLDRRDRLDAVADAIIECDTVAELLARLAN